MPAHAQHLDPGRVYRTAHLACWSANPTRLARSLEAEGVLQKLSHGLFHAPAQSRFGTVPPSDEALLHAFFDGTPYVVTGPPRWNALGLGGTQLFAHPLVYNTKRTGQVAIGGRTFLLRRVAFPVDPPAEWFVVDLLRNAEAVGLTREALERSVKRALTEGRFDAAVLAEMAGRFGRKAEQAVVRRATS